MSRANAPVRMTKPDTAYGRLIEAQILRIKRCLGATLLTRKIASQEREGVIIANIINL